MLTVHNNFIIIIISLIFIIMLADLLFCIDTLNIIDLFYSHLYSNFASIEQENTNRKKKISKAIAR